MMLLNNFWPFVSKDEYNRLCNVHRSFKGVYEAREKRVRKLEKEKGDLQFTKDQYHNQIMELTKEINELYDVLKATKAFKLPGNNQFISLKDTKWSHLVSK